MKKLKTFTGLINFLAAAIIVVVGFFALPFASNFMPEGGSWPTFFLATVYTAFKIVFCVIAFLQIIYALYYLFAHPRVRSFYSVGCILCALDITSLVIICYLAVFITREIGVCNFALLSAGVAAVQIIGIVLKFVCLFKFNPEDPDGTKAAEEKKLKKEQQKAEAAAVKGATPAPAAKPVKEVKSEKTSPEKSEKKPVKENAKKPPEKGAASADKK